MSAKVLAEPSTIRKWCYARSFSRVRPLSESHQCGATCNEGRQEHESSTSVQCLGRSKDLWQCPCALIIENACTLLIEVHKPPRSQIHCPTKSLKSHVEYGARMTIQRPIQTTSRSNSSFQISDRVQSYKWKQVKTPKHMRLSSSAIPRLWVPHLK